MEDIRIAFETAKLAKEKGFPQEPNRLKIPYYNYKGEFKGDVKDWLRKYLRKEDTSDVESYHDLTSDGTKIQFYTSWGFLQQKDKNGNRNVNGWYDEYNDWKTYEEALEIGLQEALKLI